MLQHAKVWRFSNFDRQNAVWLSDYIVLCYMMELRGGSMWNLVLYTAFIHVVFHGTDWKVKNK